MSTCRFDFRTLLDIGDACGTKLANSVHGPRCTAQTEYYLSFGHVEVRIARQFSEVAQWSGTTSSGEADRTVTFVFQWETLISSYVLNTKNGANVISLLVYRATLSCEQIGSCHRLSERTKPHGSPYIMHNGRTWPLNSSSTCHWMWYVICSVKSSTPFLTMLYFVWPVGTNTRVTARIISTDHS